MHLNFYRISTLMKTTVWRKITNLAREYEKWTKMNWYK